MNTRTAWKFPLKEKSLGFRERSDLMSAGRASANTPGLFLRIREVGRRSLASTKKHVCNQVNDETVGYAERATTRSPFSVKHLAQAREQPLCLSRIGGPHPEPEAKAARCA